MGDVSHAMLDKTINAFIKEDSVRALWVCGQDGILDGLRDQIIRELITFMAQAKQSSITGKKNNFDRGFIISARAWIENKKGRADNRPCLFCSQY